MTTGFKLMYTTLLMMVAILLPALIGYMYFRGIELSVQKLVVLTVIVVALGVLGTLVKSADARHRQRFALYKGLFNQPPQDQSEVVEKLRKMNWPAPIDWEFRSEMRYPNLDLERWYANTSYSISDRMLNNANFAQADLSNLDLSHAIMGGCNVQAAMVENTNFAEAQMGYCNFFGAYLRGASFEKAFLVNASFVSALLAYAKFDGADLRGVNFTHARMLEKAHFSPETILPDGTKWTKDTDVRRFSDTTRNDYSYQPFLPEW